MSAIKIIGIDLGKSTFHLVAMIIRVNSFIDINFLEISYCNLSQCTNQC